jgi:hypothetical protein
MKSLDQEVRSHTTSYLRQYKTSRTRHNSISTSRASFILTLLVTLPDDSPVDLKLITAFELCSLTRSYRREKQKEREAGAQAEGRLGGERGGGGVVGPGPWCGSWKRGGSIGWSGEKYGSCSRVCARRRGSRRCSIFFYLGLGQERRTASHPSPVDN